MYLTLAENPQSRHTIAKNALEYYVPIPTKSGNVLAREDALDDLSDEDFNNYMDQLEASGMLGGKKKAERQARRQERKANKAIKRSTKTEKKAANVAIRQAKAKGIEAGTYKPGVGSIIESIGSAAGNILGKTPADDGSTPAWSIDASAGNAAETKPNYVLWIGGGLAVLLLIGGIAYGIKKK